MIKKGRGLASVIHPTGFKGGGDPDQATIRMKSDGTFDLMVGAVEKGQGARTVLRQIASDALDVPIDNITIHNHDTDTMPFSTDTAASRITFITGNAILKAAEDLNEKIRGFAAPQLGVAPEEIVLSRMVAKTKDGEKSLDYAAIGTMSNWGGAFLVGNGAYLVSPGQNCDPVTGEIEFSAAMAYATCLAEVEVDTETGVVNVTKLYSTYEIGKCINPLMSEGQIDGGSIMGVGMALMEDLFPYYPSLDCEPSSFTDYIIPTACDIPEMKYSILEMADPRGPYGAKGFGEMTTNPQPPAIANAIHDAIGVWICDLPITPERILDALEEQGA